MGKQVTPNKKVKNATPLEYDKIKFKSKLEVFAYKKLNEAGLEALYEPQAFPLLDKFNYKGIIFENYNIRGEKIFNPNLRTIKGIRYTPDFVSHKYRFVIECKGYSNDRFPLVWKLFKKYLNDHNMGDYLLFLPTNQKQVKDSVSYIKELRHEELRYGGCDKFEFTKRI